MKLGLRTIHGEVPKDTDLPLFLTIEVFISSTPTIFVFSRKIPF